MKRTSIRIKLMLIMICLTLLPVITITWIATSNTKQSVEKELIEGNRARILWADQYLNELTEQMDALFYSLQINQDLMDGIRDKSNQDVGFQYRFHNLIRETLTTAFFSNSRKIDDLTLSIATSGEAYTVNHTGMITTRMGMNEGVWSRMEQGPINMYFAQEDHEIYVLHSINRFEDRKLLGGIATHLNQNVWNEVSTLLLSESDSSVYLLNDEGELLSGTDDWIDNATVITDQFVQLSDQNSELDFRKTNDGFYFMKRVGAGGITIVKFIPISTVTASAKSTVEAGIFTGILFGALSIVLSILVSLQITRPIISLARTMYKTNFSNFEQKSVQSQDEIGLLQVGYNNMMLRIKELIEEEYQHEINVKSAQLMALQAQINPHFLNNTLHMIGGMALMKGAPEIYIITNVIGELLRYSISYNDLDQLVTLEDEIKHTRNYIFIQENRFSGRCSITISSDPELSQVRLPKFTLQPLIENAFEHGLQPQEGTWVLDIRVTRVRNRIALIIQDKGVGMSEERKRQLRQGLKDGEYRDKSMEHIHSLARPHGIGLMNVHSRLKLQFGPKFGLRIFSKDGEGTLIIAILPTTLG
ncbi:sensor histidine kinase [Paenibacillus segetis]|uniref:HAMP domain-containing protein n=1 Tax=Paenibacillus segetis TaxID=1325360 RepID=A0ABQ1YEH9_9BACL|nr:sensor histidine kinase [Paenibacillus segetis]GGH23242.1 hypothetical protein GCM10008013_22190 [Paenibacillus segetis]